MKAGVLALQGAFREHREVLDALGIDAVEVRLPRQPAGLLEEDFDRASSAGVVEGILMAFDRRL